MHNLRRPDVCILAQSPLNILLQRQYAVASFVFFSLQSVQHHGFQAGMIPPFGYLSTNHYDFMTYAFGCNITRLWETFFGAGLKELDSLWHSNGVSCFDDDA